MNNFAVTLEAFLARCKAAADAEFARLYPSLEPPTFTTTSGPKYVKIIRHSPPGSGGSAYAFVEKTTGDIFKPASWKAPAKHARGNIATTTLGWLGPAYLR